MQAGSPALDDRTFRQIADLMYQVAGLSLNESKRFLVSSRLTPRLYKLGLHAFDEYYRLLVNSPPDGELQSAIDLLTTNETYFFREPRHFEALESYVLQTNLSWPMTVWSAAASYGDEVYSVAMLLSDLEAAGRLRPGWSLMATDISTRVLTAAKEAIFPADRLRDVTPQRLRRYCMRGEGPAEGLVLLKDELRERVKFGQLNLTQDFEGIGPFDVVLLRNVLSYFDAPTKLAVIQRVLKVLRPGGLFFLGTAEGRVPAGVDLKFVQPGVYLNASGAAA